MNLPRAGLRAPVRLTVDVVAGSEAVVQVYGFCIHLPVISVIIIGVLRLSYNRKELCQTADFRTICSIRWVPSYVHANGQVENAEVRKTKYENGSTETEVRSSSASVAF